jgi:hypothetical protein
MTSSAIFNSLQIIKVIDDLGREWEGRGIFPAFVFPMKFW